MAVGEAEEGVREGEEVPRSIGEVGGEVILADHDDGVVVRVRLPAGSRSIRGGGSESPPEGKLPMPVENGVIAGRVAGHDERQLICGSGRSGSASRAPLNCVGGDAPQRKARDEHRPSASVDLPLW